MDYIWGEVRELRSANGRQLFWHQHRKLVLGRAVTDAGCGIKARTRSPEHSKKPEHPQITLIIKHRYSAVNGRASP